MKQWLALVLCIGSLAVHAAPSILNASTHADDKIAPAVNAVLGAGKVDNPIFIDYCGSCNAAAMVAASSNGAATYTSVAQGTSVNHVTYAVINASLCCWRPDEDYANYATLEAQGTVYTQPIAVGAGGTLPVGTAPPVSMVAASAPNSGDGGTSWGTEFALSASYLGLDTSADSWVSAEMAGLLAALQYNHPTWNFFDIKAVLRVTAANWATGYNASSFGYGAIAWSAANTLSSISSSCPSTGTPTSACLQPPGMQVVNQLSGAVITLYPFRQTRRTAEVIYSVSSSYVWPVKNEYVASDLAASGGTLLYTSNGTDVTPTFTYIPAATGTVTFIAFTTDGTHYSRAEPFSEVSAALMVGTACTP